MNVPVVVHDRRKHVKLQLNLLITERDTIKTILQQISLKTGIPHDQLSSVLCGRILEDSTEIKDLLLGPTTSLVVLAESTARPQTSSSLSDRPQIGSFYLWCKKCGDLTRGKLRVYCSTCSSSAIIVQSEPTGWSDLVSKRISIQCDDCQSAGASAQFRFKCISCNEIAAPLRQVRGNWENSSCLICAEENHKFLFDFGCNHPICRGCFTRYVETSLKEGKFSFRTPFGYTIGCAYSGCDYVVKDAHHFHVVGEEKYKMYQELATEKLLGLHEQATCAHLLISGVRCPYPDCTSSFFWENDNDDEQVYCPNCFRQFCRNCNSRECTCDNPDELSQVTIAASSKKCPGCNAATSRTGGCAHMKCTSCGFHWCYRCVLPWSDECQWDHWFG